MIRFVRVAVPALSLGCVLLLAGASAQAACITKGGRGTGGSIDNAKFQAWEAVLQATDWSSWAGFMAGGGKVGSAPGYKVSDVKSRCQSGGLGHVCVMQARLCK